MSEEEILDRVGKIFDTRRVVIPPGMIEEGKVTARILEANRDKLKGQQ